MEHKLDIDRRVLRLAESQNGPVARRQLLELGMSAETIRTRRANGRLVTVGRGVYVIGHRSLRPEGWWMVAVLECGPKAVLSHRSAARLWGLRPYGGDPQITVRSSAGIKKRDGILIHRCPLPDREVTTVDGIPATTVSRTLLDLAALVPAHHLRRAIERAEQLELFDLNAMTETIGAHPRQPGRRQLLALVADMAEHGLPQTRSDVEAAFLQLCVDHHLPRPQVNTINDGREHDFAFPAHNLIVEVDGYAYHRSRAAFAGDRQRDRDALRRGVRVARFTAAEIAAAPTAVAAELRMLINLT